MQASSKQQGFTLLMLLAAIFLLALASNGVITYVSHEMARVREAQLLRIGQMYVQAIGSYYEFSPGQLKQWPRTLEDLTEDRRFVGMKRHLRQVYLDPLSPSTRWGIIQSPDGGVAGVYSINESKPIHESALDLQWDDGSVQLVAANRYSDWQFVYQPKPFVGNKAR